MLPACMAHCLAFWLCLITSSLAVAPPAASAKPSSALHVYATFVTIFFPPRDLQDFPATTLDRPNIRSPWSKQNASHEDGTPATKRAFCCCAATVPKANSRAYVCAAIAAVWLLQC